MALHRDRSPLRIGLDGDTLGRKRTGDESYLASLMGGLNRVDQENDYVVFVRDAAAVGKSFADLSRFRFQTVVPRSIWLRHPFGFPLALRRPACGRLDLLHVQYFLPPLPPCPVVVTAHDISFAVHPEFFTRKDRIMLNALVPRALRRADRIITDAEHTRNDMVTVYGLNPAKIEVIPLAADPRYRLMDRGRCRRIITERHDLTGGFILYVGNLQPRKNVATLIQAYGLFRQRTGLSHKLVIVGKTKYKYGPVFDAIAESGVADDVLLTGFVPDEDLPVYYNAADVFVFPTLYEGFGLPVIEAMACGTPVISTHVSSIPEVAGDAAILVDPSEPEAFSDALAKILGDEALAENMRKLGLERAATFSWDRTARETLAVYYNVLDGRDGGRKQGRSLAEVAS